MTVTIMVISANTQEINDDIILDTHEINGALLDILVSDSYLVINSSSNLLQRFSVPSEQNLPS